MKTALCFILPILFFNFTLLSQQVSGIVQDSTGKPVSGANVLLLSTSDSAILKGASTNDSGKFSIENNSSYNFLLNVSAVGFKSFYLTLKNNTIKLPLIVLQKQPAILKEVLVTSKKPLIEQRIDRMIVNVGNTIISSSSTALEILQKTPGITFDQQADLLQLRGKEGVIVQIDGKQTYLAAEQVVAMLRNMPGSTIDRIEIITNPSARYDAAGNAGIIDVRLKKNTSTGTNGSASLSAGSGRYYRQRGALQLNHKTGSINLFTNYGINNGGDYWDFDLQKIQEDGAQKNYVHQTSLITYKNTGHNAKAGIDIQTGKATTIGLLWTGSWNRRNEESPASASFRRQKNSNPYLATLTDKSIMNTTSNQLGNINFQHNLIKNQGQLTADLDFGRFTRQFFNSLSTETLIPADPPQASTGLLSVMPTHINIFSAQTDYSRTQKNGWNLQAGWKSSIVRSSNNMQLSRGETGNLLNDSALSNNFRYRESIHAGYLNGSGKIDSVTEVQIGLRIENTLSDAYSLTQQKRIQRNYLNFFPSVFISRELNKKNTLTLSYSHRIFRPSYQNLNPVRSYLDPYAYSRGNSFLTPDFTHSFEIRHGYKAKLFTTLGASFTRNMIFFVIRPVDAQTTERSPENLGKLKDLNLTVTVPVTVVKGWTMQYTAMATYSGFNYSYLDSLYAIKQVSGRLNINNAFVLGKGWTAELAGWVTTPAVEALFHYPWQASADIGIQKVLNASFKLKFSFSDIFHSDYVNASIKTTSFSSRARIHFDSRVALLNLTYSFGNQQIKNTRQRKSVSEEEMKRLQ